MNVIHLTSGGDVGGAKTHVLSLLRELGKTDRVHLVCFTDGPFAEEARELGIATSVIRSANLFSVVASVARMAKEMDCQILHCHGARANLVGSLLRKKVSCPVITTVHSDYRLDYLGRPFARMTYGVINAAALRRLDYHVGVSDPTADMLIARGFDPQRIFSIYNGVEFPAPTPAMTREAYLRSVGLSDPDGRVVIGIAARLSAVKDVGTLIRGFADAVKVCPDLRLLIAGDGEQKQELERLAEKLCPAGTCIFCGWLSDMNSFYNALDVNTLTSLSEAFPYALPEGARYRCATVATRVGGVPYYIEHGTDGLLFTPGDTKTLTEFFCRLARDEDLRRTLADRLYEKTLRDFSVDATVRRQKEIYDRVLRKQARKTRSRDGVMICGAYGRDNAGDDAILESIVTQMRKIDPEIPLYVLSRKPRETAVCHRIGGVYTFDFFRFCRVLRKTCLYINGGGSLIQDVTSSRSLWYYLLSIAMAKKQGNKVLMYGCGIGPVSGRENRRLAGRVIDGSADIVTLREDLSLQELSSMGVKKPEMKVTADPAVLLEPAARQQVDALLQSLGVGAEEQILLISLRKWNGMERRCAAVAAAVTGIAKERGLRPVYLAMEPATDLEICRKAAEMTGAHAVCMAAPGDSHLLIGVIKRARLVVAMRLHALIFAAGMATPLVGLSYDPKVTGFLRYIGNPRCLQLEELTEQTLTDAVMQTLDGDYDCAAEAARLRSLAEENRIAAERLLQS